MNITQEVSNFLDMFGPCEIMTRGSVDLSSIKEEMFERKEHATDLAVFNGDSNFGYNEVDAVTTLMYFGSVQKELAPTTIFASSSAGHKYCKVSANFHVYSKDPAVIAHFEPEQSGETTTPEPPATPKSSTTRPPDMVWGASLYTGGTVREDDLDDFVDDESEEDTPNIW